MIRSELTGKRIHVIGAGGTGMSPISLVLSELGALVSGSDRAYSEYTERLKKAGVEVKVPQSAENVHGAEMVVYSSAVKADNPELAEAVRLGIPAMKRRDFLKLLLKGRKVIAFAGSHGKTTTSSMMVWTLRKLGIDAGFILGSMLRSLGTNAAAGSDELFVIEADEYDRMFLGIHPYCAVLTRVEYDHPDCFPTREIYFDAFRDFLAQTVPDGKIFLNGEDGNQDRFAEERAVRYGCEADDRYRATDLSLGENGCYRFVFDGQYPVELQIPGKHNVYNAAAVLAVCGELKLDLTKAAAALGTFGGVGRRFEVTEWPQNLTTVDDYAHHPTEIRATLAAARERFAGRRIWAIWQPHTYSRTRELLDDFAGSFSDADELIVTDIYAAREKKTDFGLEDVLRAIRHPHCHPSMNNDETVSLLVSGLQPGDVVVTLSAGDANLAAPAAMERLTHVQ